MTKTSVTQAYVARAVKGVKAAGIEVGRVEIGRDGTVIVYTTAGTQQDAPSELDLWRRKNGQG